MIKPSRLEFDAKQLNALLDRIEQHKLTEADYSHIEDILRSMAGLSHALEDQNLTIYRLRKIFGFKAECARHDPKPDEENSEMKQDPKQLGEI